MLLHWDKDLISHLLIFFHFVKEVFAFLSFREQGIVLSFRYDLTNGKLMQMDICSSQPPSIHIPLFW